MCKLNTFVYIIFGYLVPFYFFIAFFFIIIVLPNYLTYQKSSYIDETKIKFSKAFFNKGLWGEFLNFNALEKGIAGNKKLVTNVYLNTAKGTTEIDIIMINEYGFYVFESKNYSGKIYGSDKNKRWHNI